MKHPFHLAAALLLAAAACDSPTEEKPEPELPDIAVGATIEDRVLQGTVDEFDLVAPEGDFRITLRVTTGSAADTLVAELLNEAGGSAGGATSVGTDTSLTAQSSPWLAAAAGSKWRIRVRGLSPNDGGSYTLRLFPRSTAPESRPGAIALGQAVDGEALDVPGDIDEFTVEGTAGEEWILFAQSHLAENALLKVQLIERGSGEVVSRIDAFGATDALEQRSSGRLRLTRTGTYLLRVSSGDLANPDVRGPYRLRVDAVNRAPEAGSAAVAPGAVVSEAIQSVGDVDEFTFTAAAGQEINLLVQLQQGMSDGVSFELLRGGQPVVQEIVATEPIATLNERGTGRIRLDAAGTYTVRVSGNFIGLPAANTGTYRFEIYPVDRRPETPGTITINGATLSGSVDRPGDVDEFPLAGTEGQLLMIHGAGGAPQAGALQVEVLNAAGEVVSAVVMTGETHNYGRRVRLPATGTYTLRVAAPFYTMMGMGPYTVGAYTVSAAPEHVSPTLTLGQTVTAERIDRPGDLDVFTLTGEAGRIMNVFLGVPAGTATVIASVRPTTQQYPFIFTFGLGMTLDAGSTGRIALESTPYEIVVDPQMLAGQANPALEAQYSLRVFPIDKRPEGRSAAYVMGDTVKTEPLYPSGDIDEYTFTIGATTNVRAYWQGPASDPGNAVWGLLYLEGTEMPVWTNFNMGPGGPVRQMTLAAGSYRLKVLNMNLDAPSETANFHGPATLSYRFAFIPQ